MEKFTFRPMRIFQHRKGRIFVGQTGHELECRDILVRRGEEDALLDRFGILLVSHSKIYNLKLIYLYVQVTKGVESNAIVVYADF
jgi:hypothetical protein